MTNNQFWSRLAGIIGVLAILSPFVSNQFNFAGVIAGLTFFIPAGAIPSVLIAFLYLALGREQPKGLLLIIFAFGSGLLGAITLVGRISIINH